MVCLVCGCIRFRSQRYHSLHLLDNSLTRSVIELTESVGELDFLTDGGVQVCRDPHLASWDLHTFKQTKSSEEHVEHLSIVEGVLKDNTV